MFVPSQSHCPVLLLSEVMVSILQPTAKWFLAFKLSEELLSILFLKPVNTAVHTIASNTTSWRACVGTGWGLPENNPFPAGMLHFFCPENSLVLCWGHCWDYISASGRILSEERSHEMKQWMLNTPFRKPLWTDVCVVQRILYPEVSLTLVCCTVPALWNIMEVTTIL